MQILPVGEAIYNTALYSKQCGHGSTKISTSLPSTYVCEPLVNCTITIKITVLSTYQLVSWNSTSVSTQSLSQPSLQNKFSTERKSITPDRLRFCVSPKCHLFSYSLCLVLDRVNWLHFMQFSAFIQSA